MNELFLEASQELILHMKKEEDLLFPHTRKIALARQESKKMENPHLSSIESPVKTFLQEHELETNRFRQIASLLGNVYPLNKTDNKFNGVLSDFKEFEKDLHFHTHQENNILFPKAIEMENTIMR